MLSAHRHQAAGQVLDVRLAGRVAQHRPALGHHGGHQRVLGAGDARLVEEDVGADELLGLELVAVAHRDRGTELLERQEVRVHPAPADHVSAGRRERDRAEAGEQRPGQQDRRADPGAERRVERLGPHASRVDPDQVGAGPFDRGTEIDQDREHRLDIPDARDVVELHRDRRRGRWRRGSEAPRSCCRRDARYRAAGGRRARGSVEAWPKLITTVRCVKRSQGVAGGILPALFFQRWRATRAAPVRLREITDL